MPIKNIRVRNLRGEETDLPVSEKMNLEQALNVARYFDAQPLWFEFDDGFKMRCPEPAPKEAFVMLLLRPDATAELRVALDPDSAEKARDELVAKGGMAYCEDDHGWVNVDRSGHALITRMVQIEGVRPEKQVMR